MRDTMHAPDRAMDIDFTRRQPGRGAFGTLVGAHGAERAYPTGTLLVCRGLADGEPLLPTRARSPLSSPGQALRGDDLREVA